MTEGEAAWQRHYVQAAQRRSALRRRRRAPLPHRRREAAWAVVLSIVAGALVAAWASL
jgi:hypothetical protein